MAPPPPSIDENIKLWNQLGWNEKWYLQKYEDVAEAVHYGWYKNGHDHYIKVGRALGRTDKIETNNIITELPSVNFPPKWDEVRYLKYNSDVLRAVNQGIFTSGYFHYVSVGRFEGRLGGLLTTEPHEVVTVPPNWDENLYLKHNVDLRKLIKDGVTSMVMLILSKGHAQDRKGGFLPDWHEETYLRVNKNVATAIQNSEYTGGYDHYLMLATLRA